MSKLPKLIDGLEAPQNAGAVPADKAEDRIARLREVVKPLGKR